MGVDSRPLQTANILIAVTSRRLLLWRWGPNQRVGQAFVHFLGLPEWSKEMKIRKSRDSWRSVMLSLPGAVNLSEAGGGGKT